MGEKWSKEKAWEWYNSRPWIRGFNGYPSNCVNRIAKEVQIIKEFAQLADDKFYRKTTK